MFYFKKGENPKLEVNVADSYSQEDVERILCFINALSNSSETEIIFKLNTQSKEDFLKAITLKNNLSLYSYNIQ